MLAFNDKQPAPYTDLPATTSNLDFFKQCAAQAGPTQPSILLLGGVDHPSWTVRQQQALLRLDRRPSDYSHAVLVCAWNVEAPAKSWALEIDPVRIAASEQRPEHAGVTEVRLAAFTKAKDYPNLAVIHVPLSGAGATKVIDAACQPLRDSARFPLLRWLAAWRAFVTAPEISAHPLLNRTPHPGAAFVAMAYEAAEITLAPAATDMQHCPESLWANAKYWRDEVGNDVTVTRLVRDPHARLQPALPAIIARATE